MLTHLLAITKNKRTMTKDTHPQTPSAREGAFKKPNRTTLREGASKSFPQFKAFAILQFLAILKGEARSISNHSISCHT